MNVDRESVPSKFKNVDEEVLAYLKDSNFQLYTAFQKQVHSSLSLNNIESMVMERKYDQLEAYLQNFVQPSDNQRVSVKLYYYLYVAMYLDSLSSGKSTQSLLHKIQDLLGGRVFNIFEYESSFKKITLDQKKIFQDMKDVICSHPTLQPMISSESEFSNNNYNVNHNNKPTEIKPHPPHINNQQQQQIPSPHINNNQPIPIINQPTLINRLIHQLPQVIMPQPTTQQPPVQQLIPQQPLPQQILPQHPSPPRQSPHPSQFDSRIPPQSQPQQQQPPPQQQQQYNHYYQPYGPRSNYSPHHQYQQQPPQQQPQPQPQPQPQQQQQNYQINHNNNNHNNTNNNINNHYNNHNNYTNGNHNNSSNGNILVKKVTLVPLTSENSAGPSMKMEMRFCPTNMTSSISHLIVNEGSIFSFSEGFYYQRVKFNNTTNIDDTSGFLFDDSFTEIKHTHVAKNQQGDTLLLSKEGQVFSLKVQNSKLIPSSKLVLQNISTSNPDIWVSCLEFIDGAIAIGYSNGVFKTLHGKGVNVSQHGFLQDHQPILHINNNLRHILIIASNHLLKVIDRREDKEIQRIEYKEDTIKNISACDGNFIVTLDDEIHYYDSNFSMKLKYFKGLTFASLLDHQHLIVAQLNMLKIFKFTSNFDVFEEKGLYLFDEADFGKKIVTDKDKFFVVTNKSIIYSFSFSAFGGQK